MTKCFETNIRLRFPKYAYCFSCSNMYKETNGFHMCQKCSEFVHSHVEFRCTNAQRKVKVVYNTTPIVAIHSEFN